jgi:short-subunit dehydrogenase
LGGRALALPIDVRVEEEVNGLATEAVAAFGGIDVWVNNAAVSLFGYFDEIPMADIRQLLEINLFGYIYGARAALWHFRTQGHGTLINVSSMVALVGQPFSIPYSISKFGIRGMSLSLAQELADEKNIHVCCVLPAVIDTPIFQHAANYMGKAVKAPEPVIPAERVALAILKLTRHPREEVTVGNMARMMRLQRLALPLGMFDRYMQKSIASKHFKNEPSSPSQGNLFEPMTNWNRVNGGWIPDNVKKDAGKWTIGSALAAVVLAGVACGAAFLAQQRNHD